MIIFPNTGTAGTSDAELLSIVETQSGRDMSVDGAKLDTIEAGAAGDQDLSGLAANGANADITSLTALDGSDLDMAGGYLTNAQNIPDMLAGRGPGYWFDGVDDYISFSNDTNLNPGTGDFSIIVGFMNLPELTTNSLWSSRDNVSDDRVDFRISSSGYLQGYLENNETSVDVFASKTIIGGDSKNHIVAFTIDRESATGLKLFIDGSEEGYSSQGSPVPIIGEDINPSGSKYIGIYYDGSSIPFKGNINSTRLFNLALTAAEVKAFSSGAPIPYKYIGASQTKIVDSDFSAGIDSFTSLRGTLTGNIDSISDGSTSKDDVLRFYASVDDDNHKMYTDSASYVNGKAFTCSFDIYIPSTNTNIDGFALSFAGKSSELIEGWGLTGSGASSSGVWTTVTLDNVLCENTVDRGIEIYPLKGSLIEFVGAGLVSDDLIYIKNFKTTQIGCVLDLSPSGITTTEWIDQSGNDLHGTVSGAIATGLPRNVLAFPATAVPSSDPNTLDDYEEGTWTPTDGTSNIGTGDYIKIGQAVFFNFVISQNSISTAVVSGLPFTAQANYYAVNTGRTQNCGNIDANGVPYRAYIDGTVIRFRTNSNIGDSSATLVTPSSSTVIGAFSGNYIV